MGERRGVTVTTSACRSGGPQFKSCSWQSIFVGSHQFDAMSHEFQFGPIDLKPGPINFKNGGYGKQRGDGKQGLCEGGI